MDAESLYVFDPYYFANDSDAYVYEGSRLEFINKSVHLVAFVSGIVPCSIFLYLVLCKTPSYLRRFSRILLICAVSDIVYLLANFCSQLRVQTSDGVMLATVTGPLRYLPFIAHCYGAAAGTMTKFVSYAMLPVQFHYRLVLLKNHNPSFCSLFSCYIVLIAIAASFSGCASFQAFCGYENPSKIDYAKYWYKEIPVPILAVAPGTYLPARILHTSFGLVTLTTYIVTILFTYLTLKHIRLNANRLSPKTLNLQRQFNRTLFMQASVPLILIIIPALVKATGALTRTKFETIEPITNMFFLFFPLLNSLSSLLFISHYRRECTRIFCCEHKIRADSSIRPHESTITHMQGQRSSIFVGNI